MHNVKIEFDERFMARPWGVICTCGFRGACLDKEEAERVKANHEQIETRMHDVPR